MEKFQNKYRIESSRLSGYDYGSDGVYFVTICTKNRECYFGKIVSTNHAYLNPTKIGQIALEYWKEIPKHYPFVTLDEFVVMPNHIHGILILNNPDHNTWSPNQFGVQSRNLGAIIRAFKSTTKRFANENNIEFEWQSRFHDSIIRDINGLLAVRKYIQNNPMNWHKNEFLVESNVLEFQD